MKVGVYLGQQAPDAGGGYTFQHEVIESFIQEVTASRHRYCVLCHSDEVRPYRDQLDGVSNAETARIPDAGLLDRIRTRLKITSPLAREHLRAPSPLQRLIVDRGIDVVWCLSAGAVLLDVPYITVVWDLQHRLQPWFPEVSAKGQWDLRESAYGWFLRRAAIVIAGNKAGREEIHGFYQIPKERIRLLPHPTPDFALRHDASRHPAIDVRRKYGITQPYVFYPAQFWAHKNHVNLLLAVNKLRKDRGIGLDVVFSGSDKGNEQHVRKLVGALHLDEVVHFLGFVPQEDLIELYRQARAMTYLSFFGPENLPPLEAFALGCPVVASNVSGSEDQLGSAALLIDPRNPEQIANAIESVYRDDTLKERLVAAGRERAHRWKVSDFVKGVFLLLDEFEVVRRCW